MKHYSFYPSLGLIFALSLWGCSKPQKTEAPGALVTVVTPTVCDMPIFSEYVGHVEANISVTVRAEVSGILTGQYFKEGQEVRRGELLLTIDSRPFEAAVAKAEATLEQNLANLKYSKEAKTRYAQLVPKDFVSKLNYDQYLTNVFVDEAIIDQNKADIDIAQINLGYCSIQAPMDSVTGVLQVKPGNYVDSKSDTNLVVLNQIQPVLLSFYVPEKDLPGIQAAQKRGNLKTQAFLSQEASHPYEGYLSIIDNQVNENTGTILLQSRFPNEDKSLWPGEFANVRLILDVKKNAIVLPTQAVQVGQEGHYVYVVKTDGTAELRAVTIGQRQEGLVIIQSGLNPDETVVLEGQVNLHPGAKVSIKTAEEEETPS